MRLHEDPVSSSALEVRFLLAELGLARERIEVPPAKPRPGGCLALNSVGPGPRAPSR